ncbi:glycosyltransferase family 2 protein [Candidatus Daviesbacteria bacterium]|nr:glycosyltransferase family 2 protein [Candidatus Daviesbacteria bacterium]
MANIVSILTVTYNSEDCIDQYLISVSNALPKNGELIIVDSCSTDKTKEKLLLFKDKFLKSIQIKLIFKNENIGYGKGNNIAASCASGKYLFILNPDTTIRKDAIEKLIEYSQNNQNVGLVAPRIVQNDGILQPSVRNLPTIWNAIKEYYIGIKDSYAPYAPLGSEPVKVECVVGAAMLIKAMLFRQLNGFNEKFFMYYEDLDLCRRIRKKGMKIVYLPESEITHKVGGSISALKEKWIKESAKIYHGSYMWFFLSMVLRLRPLK